MNLNILFYTSPIKVSSVRLKLISKVHQHPTSISLKFTCPTGVKQTTEKSDRSKDIILPALWEVWREGHNTVSQSERLAAWKSLINWVQHGTFITGPKPLAITSQLNSATVRTQNVFIQGESKAPKPIIQNGAATCQVLNIHPVWKTFYLNILPDTMEQIGVKQVCQISEIKN